MKRFSLEEYNKHIAEHGEEPKLITRGGRRARIICTNMNSNDTRPIVALVRLGLTEKLYQYTIDGKYLVFDCAESDKDLFFADIEPEKKRVPLTYEDLFERVKQGKTMWVIRNCYVINIVDFDDDYIYFVNGTNGERKIEGAEYEYFQNLDAIFADGTPCWKEIDN